MDGGQSWTTPPPTNRPTPMINLETIITKDLPHRAHYIDEVKSCRVCHDLGGGCSCSNGCYHGGKRNGHYRQCLAQRHLLLSKRG